MQDTQQILSQLFDRTPMTFRRLQKLTKISPNTLRKRLGELKCQKLIHENGRKNRKRGQSLSYSLTEKGKTEYLKQTISKINEDLNNFHRILPILEKENLWLYREFKRKLYPTVTVGGENGGEIPLEQDNHWKMQKLNQTFEQYKKALDTFKEAFLTFWAEWETYNT